MKDWEKIKLLEENKEGCSNFVIVGDYCGRPWAACSHMMCSHCRRVLFPDLEEYSE